MRACVCACVCARVCVYVCVCVYMYGPSTITKRVGSVEGRSQRICHESSSTPTLVRGFWLNITSHELVTALSYQYLHMKDVRRVN